MYEVLLQWLISFLMGLAPFVFWPWAHIPYEIPRVWFVLGVIDCLIVLSLPLLYRSIPKQKSKLFRIVGLFIVCVILSSVFGVDIRKSVFGNPWRLDGIITLLHLAILSYLISLLPAKAHQRILRFSAYGALGTSLIVCTMGAALYFGYRIPSVDGAIGAMFGQPNFLAGYLVVSLPLSLYLGRYAIPVMIMQMGAILFTQSLGGLVGIIAWITLLCADYVSAKYKNIRYFLIVFGAIFICIIIYYSISQTMNQPDIVAESRVRIFAKGILAFAQRPILGWGWSNFDYAFRAVDYPFPFKIDAYVDKAHAHLLEILTTTGLVGFIIYGYLLYHIHKLLIHKKKILWFVFLLYVFHSQTNVTSIAEELLFWLIIGLV